MYKNIWTNHLVTSADKHGDRSAVGTLFNDQHLLSRGSESHLANTSSRTQLVGAEVLETRHNTAVCGDGNQFDLGTTDPSNGGQLVLEQQVVGLVVETPLANNEVSTGALKLLNHLSELLPLVILELLELLDGGDVELVLGLGLGGLEGASQDSQLGVQDLVGHLRMREVLVDNDTLDEQRVLEGTSDLAVHLNQLEVNILALEIGNRENSIHSNLSELVVRLGDAGIGLAKGY